TDGRRVVLGGRARHSAAPGLTEPWQLCAHERSRLGGRQLALALHRRGVVRTQLPVAARFDGEDETKRGSSKSDDPQPGGSDRETRIRKTNEVTAMKATELLHNLGQSLWLDNITRDLLNSGTLDRYIHELSVTGLTSNPTIFDHAIKNSS